MLVLLGEVGGVEEYEVVEALKTKRIVKPIVAWCIGTCAGACVCVCVCVWCIFCSVFFF